MPAPGRSCLQHTVVSLMLDLNLDFKDLMLHSLIDSRHAKDIHIPGESAEKR